MNWLNKMERKFGRYAITNLSVWLIGAYVVGYMLLLAAPNLLQYLTLEPALILKGQVWRLVTWVLMPPDALNIFTFIMLFLYYSLGTTLEKTWGTFRYNLYIFSGILFTIIGAMLLYAVSSLFGIYIPEGLSIGNMFSTYYINMSIFLAFAACYPDMKIMLYFIIPVKIKWIAWFDAAYLLLIVLVGGWITRVAIIASILNFIVFFFATRNYMRMSPKQVKRRKSYRNQVADAQSITRHKCAICGRTEEDDPYLQFRFCSKCEGNYEYCQDHLFTHEHKR